MTRNLETTAEEFMLCEDRHLGDLSHELSRSPGVDTLMHKWQKLGSYMTHIQNEAWHLGRHKKFVTAAAGAGAVVAAATVGIKHRS